MTDEIKPIDYSSYDNPEAVLLDAGLSKDAKLEILEKWKEDEEALIRASAEGMTGGERPHLRQVELALDSLTGEDKGQKTGLKRALKDANFETIKGQVDSALGTPKA